MIKPSENANFNFLEILSFLNRWKKPLLIVMVLSLIFATIFSGPAFIKPKYKATTVFFPTITNTIGRVLLQNPIPGSRDILEIGEEQQAEQLMQILRSEELLDKINKKYNLVEHYDIKPDSKYLKTELKESFSDNVKVERTEFSSVRIEVTDTDPALASGIANDIVVLMDTVISNMQRKRALEGLKIMEVAYNEKLQRVQLLTDSINQLRKKGLFDYTIQVKLLNKALLKKGTDKVFIKSQLDMIAKHGGQYILLNDLIARETGSYMFLKEQSEKARIDAYKTLPHEFIVNYAEKPEKKASPVRWLIVLISFVSTLFLSIFTIIILESLESFRNLNPKPQGDSRGA